MRKISSSRGVVQFYRAADYCPTRCIEF